MDKLSKILHERVDTRSTLPNVTPLYQCSSFFAESDYFYTRKANPNTTELEQVLKTLEGCEFAGMVTTGMAAISMALRFLKPKDHLIVDRLIYGCTYKLFQDFCAHYDLGLDFVDLTNAEWVRSISPQTRMVFFETPTNPFLKTIPIETIRRQADQIKSGILLVVDNTWATPLFQRPLTLGADLCVYSATKFYSGHSDCMGGVISTNRNDLAETISQIRFLSGGILDPHSAWLIRRSMQTFRLRMQEHERVIKKMASFLHAQAEIERVYLPEVGGQLEGYGCILFCELKEQFEANVDRFLSGLSLFERGTSMASVVSAVAQPYFGSHLTLSPEEKKQMGIKPTLIRLCFGLEEISDLIDDLKTALRRLHD